jgi:hypothetical protein
MGYIARPYLKKAQPSQKASKLPWLPMDRTLWQEIVNVLLSTTWIRREICNKQSRSWAHIHNSYKKIKSDNNLNVLGSRFLPSWRAREAWTVLALFRTLWNTEHRIWLSCDSMYDVQKMSDSNSVLVICIHRFLITESTMYRKF